MKNIVYLLVGTLFGLALTKGEAISWFRIQEMFHFQGFHMFGIFMTAIPVGALGLWLLRKNTSRALDGSPLEVPTKQYHHGVVLGSLIFGFGWALTGACPGPLYAQIGAGYSVTILSLLSAVAGTWVFGKYQDLLPD